MNDMALSALLDTLWTWAPAALCCAASTVIPALAISVLHTIKLLGRLFGWLFGGDK